MYMGMGNAGFPSLPLNSHIGMGIKLLKLMGMGRE